MTYRSLLVFLDRDPLCAARTQVAMRLAKDLDCHLVGLAPTGLVNLAAFSEAATAFGEFSALAWESLRGQGRRHARDARNDDGTGADGALMQTNPGKSR